MKNRKTSAILFFITITFLVCIVFGCLYLYFANINNNHNLQLNINYLNNYISSKLNSVFPNSKIEIASTTLIWSKKEENFSLLSKGISITNSNLGIDINIPEILLSSRVGLLFLWDNFNFTSVQITNPQITFSNIAPQTKKDPDLKYYVNLSRKFFEDIIAYNIPIKINNLILHKYDTKQQLIIETLNIDKHSEYDRDILNIVINGSMYEKFLTKLQIFENYKNTISIAAEYKNFDTRILQHFNIYNDLFNTNWIKLNGSFITQLNSKNEITHSNIIIKESKGKIAHVKDKIIQNISAELIYDKNILNIKNISGNVGSSNLYIKGKVDFSNEKKPVSLEMYIDTVSTKDVITYWPSSLYNKVHTWSKQNILDGKINNIKISFDDELINVLKNNKNLNIKLAATIRDAIVKFHKNENPVNIIKGQLYLDSNDFHVEMIEAKFHDVLIKNGMIKSKINKQDAVLDIYGSSDSAANKLYNALTNINLIRNTDFFKMVPHKINGIGFTELNFQIFNINNQHKLNTRIDIKSQLNIEISEIYDVFNINKAKVNLKYTNNALNINMSGIMNNEPITLKIHQSFIPEEDSVYEFVGDLLTSDIKKLGFTSSNILNGRMHSKVKLHINEKSIIEGIVDLKKLDINIPYIKSKNYADNLYFTAFIKDKSHFVLQKAIVVGKDLRVEMYGEIGKNTNLIFNKIQLLDNIFTASATKQSDNIKIDINGSLLNFKLIDVNYNYSKNDAIFNNIKINANFKHVKMHNNITIKNAAFNINCVSKKCKSATFTGYLSNNIPFRILYGPIGLEIMTDNAGEFLKGFDIVKTIEGGKLSFYMYPINNDKTSSGMFSLSSFYMVDASILAQILTLYSLQGIAAVLNGKGIYFDTLTVPFAYYNGIVKLEESWMEGAELGISILGDVDIKNRLFDIKGQIIPAYIINKSIWKIPVLGKILTGGQSRGVIAIDYRVAGSSKKNDLFVNLMSILAPNVLKKVLGILNSNIISNIPQKKVKDFSQDEYGSELE